MAQSAAFGKAIKKKLIDMDQTQIWLIEKVKEKTGLYFDSSYMSKIINDRLSTPSIVNAICDILGIEYIADENEQEDLQ